MFSTKIEIPVKRFILYALDIVVIFISFLLQIYNPDNIIWTIVGVSIFNIIFALNSKKNRMTFLLFNITFFTFLLSQLVVLRIEGKPLFYGYLESTKNDVYSYLIIGLLAITIGQLIYEKSHKDTQNLQTIIDSIDEVAWEKRNKVMLFVISLLFFVTYPFSFLDLMDKAIFVGNYSYSAYYLEYTSRMPYVLTKIAGLNRMAFALLLCVEHRKRKLLIPCILYGLTALISLGMGQRNIFVLDALMFIVLIKYANSQSLKYRGELLYSKKLVSLVIAVVPILIIFLGYWKYARAGHSFEFNDIFVYFIDFFYRQGEQIGFFANTLEFETEIWKQEVPYTFSALYNYLRNLFGMIDFGIYTRANAFYGNSLAATQFYITSPGSLVNGSGSGCCYLSELYFDFGMVGIILGSIIIGYVLGALKLNENNNWYQNAFIALMIRSIIYIPRASFFDWIVMPFNIWNIAIVFCIIATVGIFSKKYR